MNISSGKFVAVVVIACFLICVGCENYHNASRSASNKGNVVIEKKAEFEIATNSDKFYEDRIIAALKLNVQDRLALQEMLLSRLPGDYSVQTMDDLSVLAEIGDEHAARSIKQLIALDRKNDILVPGQINGARHYAIKKIKERLENKSSSFLTPIF